MAEKPRSLRPRDNLPQSERVVLFSTSPKIRIVIHTPYYSPCTKPSVAARRIDEAIRLPVVASDFCGHSRGKVRLVILRFVSWHFQENLVKPIRPIRPVDLEGLVPDFADSDFRSSNYGRTLLTRIFAFSKCCV